MTESLRVLPMPTPETQHFWDGTREGELRLQQCNDCQHVYFPPRPFCPKCSSRDVQVMVASGRASLESYVISHRPHKAFVSPTRNQGPHDGGGCCEASAIFLSHLDLPYSFAILFCPIG